MASLLQYKCPRCGGTIEFDSDIQKPKCPYCDTEYEIEDLAAYDEEMKGDQADDINWQSPNEQWVEQELGEDGMKIYVCESCGGEVVVEETAAALKCPWCDNPIVIKGSVAGSLRPNFVIPFRLDKEAAKAAFKKHLLGKKFLPRVFSDENHIDEIRGVYVPFWLFDADADANYRLRGTTSRHWSSGNYAYTETSYYSLVRRGQMSFDNVPVDASQKMADDLMDSLEPFDYKDMVDFQTAYLSGYLADKYDVSAEESQDRANARIKNTAADRVCKTATGYSGITVESGSVQIAQGQVDYVLMPVWFMKTTWEGNNYTFAMNGQTGKFVGNLPLDKKAKNRFFWTRFLLTGLISFAVCLALWLLFGQI